MPEHTHIDVVGNKIREGSFVAYSASIGRSAILKFGIVTRLAERDVAHSGYDDDTRYTVRLITVDRHDKQINDDGTRGTWKLQNKGNEITASYMDRLLVVSASHQLPPGVRELLEEGVRQLKKRREQDRH